MACRSRTVGEAHKSVYPAPPRRRRRDHARRQPTPLTTPQQKTFNNNMDDVTTLNQLQVQSPKPNVTPANQSQVTSFLAYVGINHAARLTGKAKEQIYRAIASGKLSWTVDPTTEKKTLQVADLDRVFGLKPVGVTGAKSGNENQMLPQAQPTVTPAEIAELVLIKAQFDAQKETIRRLDDQVSDLRQQRDRLMDQNNRLTLLLPAPTPVEATSQPVANSNTPEPSPKRGLWDRIIGR